MATDDQRRRFLFRSAALLGGGAVAALTPKKAVAANAIEARRSFIQKLVRTEGLAALAAQRQHHFNGRFINPFGNRIRRGLGRVLYWKLFADNKFRKYYESETVVPVQVDLDGLRQSNRLSITFLKHATVIIRDLGRTIYVDPVFNSISRFIKDFSPLAFDLEMLPRPDVVLITHGHYDHLDKASLRQLPPETRIVTPLGYDDLLNDLGMTRHTALDWFESYSPSQGRITLLPCNHWTMRNPIEGPNRALWGSYVIHTAAGPTLFISGDTGYFEGFSELGQRYAIDLAIFNLSAYEPRWFMASSHMNPEETVRAFRDLRARKMMIVHWGTFRLGDEPVHFPPRDIRRAMAAAGLDRQLIAIQHGETHHLS